ncbi:MAG: ABC transporter permease [Polyangiaceae bacterium]|nr:ABC transporter permease [Polyangiaceae bacterium]
MSSRLRRVLGEPWIGPLVALLVVYAMFAVVTPDTFLRGVALEMMARHTVVVAFCSVGMTLVIIQGGIDLSVGSVVALVTVVTASLLRSGYSPAVAALGAVLAGALCGALNGALVAGLKITPFIVTLGTMSALRGLAKGFAGEQKIDADAGALEKLMLRDPDSALPFPPGVFLAIVVALFGAALLAYSRFGRHIVATGSSPATARLCGISIPRVTIVTYTLAGLLAGIAGMMEFSTLTVGDPTDSIGLELEVIAAVVIGGGSLFGGQGSVAGSVLGAMLMTVIATGATHVGIANWIQEILTGAIIVVAVTVDRMRHR